MNPLPLLFLTGAVGIEQTLEHVNSGGAGGVVAVEQRTVHVRHHGGIPGPCHGTERKESK